MAEDTIIEKIEPPGIADLADKGEQAAAERGEKTKAQIISTDLVELNVLKRKGDQTKYQEYLEQIAPEIKKLYFEGRSNFGPGYRDQVRSEAIKHGIDLSSKPNEVLPQTSQRIIASTEEAKQKIGEKGIIKALRNLRESRLNIFRRISKTEEKKPIPTYPSETPISIPIKK